MKIPLLGGFNKFHYFATILILGVWVNALGQEPSARPGTNPRVTGEQFKPAGEVTKDSSDSQDKIKVIFDENSPGLVIIESNGEKLRVDTTKKTVEQVAANEDKGTQPNTQQDNAKSASDKKDKDESAYDFDKGEEPYDYRDRKSVV